MPNIATLNGISDAREDLYTRLDRGEVTETRALAQERILRGQTELKANTQIRLLGLVLKSKSKHMETYAMPLIRALHKFTTGEELPALEPHKG